MNKKGFTLVELIAVISILAVIALIAITSVDKVLQRNRQNSYNIQVSTIIESAKQWELEHSKVLPQNHGDKKIIQLGELQYDGFADENINNPMTGKTFDPETEICITNDSGNYTHEITQTPCVSVAPETCFSFDSSTGTINKYYNNENNSPTMATCPKVVRIPDKIDGKEIKSIGNNSFKGLNIQQVIIPKTVETIGDYAFEGNAITNVYMASIKTIGISAFAGNQIESVVLPESLTSIDAQAFSKNSIKKVLLGKNIISILSGAFSDNNIEELTYKTQIPAGLNNISDKAFSNNAIKELVLTDWPIVGIGNYAFYNNEIVKLRLPKTVTYIGDGAFSNNNIDKLDLKELNIESIQTSCFENNKITELQLPTKLKSIGVNGFRNNLLTEIKIVKSLTTISEGSFKKNALNNVQVERDTIQECMNLSVAWYLDNNFFDYGVIEKKEMDGAIFIKGINCKTP